MDDLRIGAVIRALRLRLGLTQAELAIKAGVSPAMISRLEHGRFETTDIRTLRRVFAALDARVDLVPRWQGAELDRLLDATCVGASRVRAVKDWQGSRAGLPWGGATAVHSGGRVRLSSSSATIRRWIWFVPS